MPKGVAVATMAIGKNGAHNAALFAISILGIQHEKLLKSLEKKREEIALSIPEEPNDNV